MGLTFRNRIVVLMLLIVSIGFLFTVQQAWALAQEYTRNGECYMLIGQGLMAQRGVYRFNNPEVPKYFSPPLKMFNPTNTFGFSVDLNRNIYTFSEVTGSGYVLIPGNLKRQVINNSVTAANADFGYHNYVHYDHRTWGAGSNIYRTGPVGRRITGNPGNVSGYLYSNGPGSAIGTPAGNPLPNITGNTSLGVYSGKQWYSIPNGSWYSAWRQATAISGRISYRVYGDKEEGLPHDWTLYTWAPNDLDLDSPVFTKSSGSVVATSYDKRVTRRIYAGCVDGCGGASGSGSSVADPFYNDIAFMPPIGTTTATMQPSRTYFYSRPQTQTGYWITRNTSPYNPPASNPLLGMPSSLSTKWIGISLRDLNSDYVYCLGNDVIKNWYNTVTGASPAGINISAVTVSNQWNQEGGIVYAYDKSSNFLYKFVRKEQGGTPLSSGRYQAIPFSSILSSIGADPASAIDDIKADGFGSLFFGMSYPSKDPNTFDPRGNFNLNDAVAISVDPPDPSDASQSALLIYRQDYGKYVFERNIYDGSVNEIGHKTYATRYYNLPIRLNQAGMNQIASLTYPSTNLQSKLASWSAELGNNDGTLDENDYSNGSDGMFTEFNWGDPGYCKLAVINIPTPPQVLSLSGKKSFLDIIGPYTNIPLPDTTNRNTNQNSNRIIPSPTTLQADQLYFYMVENYPLGDGAQNPNSQVDWDNDGKKGGFITSMVNPESSANTISPGKVYYEWRTWLVEDVLGKPVYPAKLITKPNSIYPSSTGQNAYTYFYSPVQGKYIMTCRVVYDWYDYDSLPFGSTINDLPSVLKTNTKATPSAAGSFAGTTGPAQLSSIMATPNYLFMAASAAFNIAQITPANDYSVLPIVVTSNNGTFTPLITEIARVQRCDDGDPLDPSDPNNPNRDIGWYPKTGMNPLVGYHGLRAGDKYNWRIDVASQSNMFFDVSSSNDPNPASTQYNYVADKLLDPTSQMYVNTNPNFVFRNLGGDVRWQKNSKIEVTAYLEYKVPNNTGGTQIIKKWLIGSNGGPAKYDPSIPANNPIVCSTDGNLPPTDPYDADLVITMKRWFDYDMWLHINNGSTWIWGSYMTLPKQLEIVARTKVMIIDTESPTVNFSKTDPINLFGSTGADIAANIGLTGRKNPANIKFTIRDNNPWEAVESVVGITNTTLWNSNRANNVMVSSPHPGVPTAQFNYKPVFAKNLNRWVNLSFDSSSRQAQGTNPVATASLDFSKSGPYSYSSQSSASSSNLVADFVNATTYETTSSGAKSYRAEVEFKMSINKITLGVKPDGSPSRKIPKGYANNTPGYHPYRFYVNLSDSSGNGLTRPDILNMVLHVNDIIPPNPYGIIRELKSDTIRYFPLKVMDSDGNGHIDVADLKSEYNSMKNVSNYAFKEDFLDLSNIWTPDNSINGYINGQVNYFQSLMHVSDNIVKNFTSLPNASQITAQVNNFIPPSYLEDNVEFIIESGVNDNAGSATSVLTFHYLDADDAEIARKVSSIWQSSSLSGGYVGQNATGSAHGVFRGRTGDFPMLIPVKMVAVDDALDWDWYDSDGTVTAGIWNWGTLHHGSPSSNERTFKTSIPVYGSKLIIRTLDQGIRNK